MEQEIENQIIKLYLSGLGSTTIAKQIPTISKRKILKLLSEKNILRNRLLGDEFYKNFWLEEDKWCGTWVCNVCNKDIKFCVNNKTILNRNLQKKHTCKQCSLEKQMGVGNPFFNKKHLPTSINKISNSRTGKYCGKDNHMFNNPTYKKIISDKAIERWNNGSMEKTRVKLSNLMKQRIASGELKSYNRSKAEDELIKILEQNNIDVIPNFLLCGKIFDVYIPIFNLLVEYNGDYWHCNPKKYDKNYLNIKKNKTAKEIWEYDKNKLYLAKNNGYNCEVIWESDYKKNKNIIIELIKIYENK
jgi:hypothetical protein